MFSNLFNTSFFTSYVFGFLSVVALFFGSFVFWKKGKEEHYDEHELIDVTLIAVMWGLIGARLAYILLNFNDFGLNILYWLSIWSKPGLHWTGLFSLSLIFFLRYCHNRKWNIYSTLDLAVIGVALAQSIVNLGIFLSASTVGTTTKLPIGVLFPGSFEKRHPVGLYAFIFWLSSFILLYWLENKYRRFTWYQKYKGNALPGFLFFVYMIAFGVIGSVTSLISETSIVYAGINIDFFIRIVVLLLGALGIFSRSGLPAKLGLDKFFSKTLKA